MSDLSEFQRRMIVGARLSGASATETAKLVGCARSMVSAVMTAYMKEREFKDISQAFTKEELDKIKNKMRLELKRWSQVEYDHHNSLAYLVGRLAANYASAFKVFYELKNRACDFEPKTFFDFGSGVGSAVWAAHAVWGNSLKEYFCVDASSDMNDISQQLLIDSETEEMLIKTVYHRQFLPASETIKYDLVVSAFSLMDLPSLKDRMEIIDTLWRKTNDFLVIIEYGNNAGFLSVLDARDYILQVENMIYKSLGYSSPGAHVIAPCPHDSTCPRLIESSYKPCGFTVPYQPLFPIGAEPPSRKDWISYVILRKGRRPETDISWPRLVKPVLKRPKHVHCRLCCSDGKLHDIIVTKSRHGRHAYRCARSSTLGDLLPVHLKPLPDRDQETEDFSHVNNDEIDTESNKT
ncbi:methyltransferase-like protein 17, mitochondrial [Stegodyphus dumicola]|uniref:methyltransferase-like protein 17, mitochondrial n=1 Tax=Stegodyphus dumicola TaxID=202533 RepID=UPI0015AFF8CA|nr:methyltransferase-like protein 17, mitochondrial [Stegodyphus dumicola]